MRILIVSRYKGHFVDHQLPFVTEQGEAIRVLGHEVGYFLVKGNYLKAMRPLKEKIREFKPDIIHAHFGLTAIPAELQSKVPVVTTFHNGETLTWYINLVTSIFSLRAKHVIYVAQHIRDLIYVKSKNYSIIPCGVLMDQMTIIPKDEARRQLGWAIDQKYIMFGGAFRVPRKNYIFLHQAVEKLLAKSDWQQIEGGEQLGNIVCVEMSGLSRKQCVLYMCAADVFVLPSHSEGSPQALKEAMALNCPCIATDIADIKDLFSKEPGHWILRNPRTTHERWDGDENSLEEMVELLKRALTYGKRTNGRKRILELELSNEQVAERIVKIYKNILKE